MVNKDRAAECERTARLVTASLSSALSGCLPSTTGFLEWEFRAPADGEPNDDETAPPDDVAAIAALDPPPETIDDVRQRLGWRKQLAANALRAWREL